MTRRSVDDPSAPQPNVDPPDLLSLGEQAQRHTQDFLAQLRAEGREVYEVPGAGDRIQLTQQAMQAGHDVICHTVLAEADFQRAVGSKIELRWIELCAPGDLFAVDVQLQLTA